MSTCLHRRRALAHLLFGSGAIGLRAMASGLPISMLLNPRRALAAITGEAKDVAAVTPQFVLMSTSQGGDPVNANAPGTYSDPGIQHPSDPSMAATTFSVGSTQTTAAKVWSQLPASALSRTCFFHHGTYTVVHPDERNVLALMGAIDGGEMLPSMLAKNLMGPLGTLRAQPISLWPDSNEAISFNGSPLPLMTPQSLAQGIAAPTNGLGTQSLLTLRDQSLDRLHSLIKQGGTPAQKAFVDAYATSSDQIRVLQDKLLSTLSSITDNSPVSQIKAAIALFHMKVTPVVTIHIPFGGDNHGDPNLGTEVAEHQSGTQTLTQMTTLLQDAGLDSQVTFVMMNVFGRTMAAGKTANGRDHNGEHHVTVMMGPHIKGSVIGGVGKMAGGDYGATAIDSGTGASSAGGDIGFSDTFGSMGKTLARAVGLSDAAVQQNIKQGTAIQAALA